MTYIINVSLDADELFPKEFENVKHFLHIQFNPLGYIELTFSTLFACKLFALSLIQEAVYGQNSQKEIYPLIEDDGYLCIIDGIRLTPDSLKLIINYDESPEESSIPLSSSIDILNLDINTENLHNEHLTIEYELQKQYTSLTFSSRLSMYIFGVYIIMQITTKQKNKIDINSIPIKTNNNLRIHIKHAD